MRLWRERLGACLGFDTQASAPLSPPQVLLVDRPRLQARHLLNAEQLAASAQQAFRGLANVTLEYMEVGGSALIHAVASWYFLGSGRLLAG
jgi:hypothetical protein